MRRPAAAVWAIVLAALAAAGIGLGLARPALAAGPTQPTDEQVRFAANVEMVKGHLLASQALYARGEREAAAVHAAHPVEELLSLLEGPLGRASAERAATLKRLLDRPSQQIKAGVPAAQLRATVREISAALDDAVSRVVPAPVRDTLAFRAGVIVELLEGVKGEYGEAVKEGQVVETVEYQDAYGFFQRARALYRPVAARVRAQDPGAATAIEGALATLGAAFAGVTPPARPTAAAAVAAGTDRIAAELGRFAGLALAAGKGPVEELGQVRSGIEQAVGAYKAGERQKAEELVTAAYLDHFEKVEAPLAERDQALMTELERAIRIELRNRIKAKAPAAEVEQLARTILTRLDQAERLLQGRSGR
ncbi:MAG TPA: hypothetical protein VNM66_01645 [Thermodesulfobacteriota bacterium]|nr:hypothetical protein [Thermodesulfobacteriota bacterium]